MFNVHLLEAKIRVLKFDNQNMTTFELDVLKNDVQAYMGELSRVRGGGSKYHPLNSKKNFQGGVKIFWFN